MQYSLQSTQSTFSFFHLCTHRGQPTITTRYSSRQVKRATRCIVATASPTPINRRMFRLCRYKSVMCVEELIIAVADQAFHSVFATYSKIQRLKSTSSHQLTTLSRKASMKADSRNEITRAAREVLSASSVRELRFLRVDGNTSHLELTGRVGSYYHKQLAQETIRQVARGMQMVNRVQVTA